MLINTFNISLQACNNTLKSYLILALLLINTSMNPTASILKYMSEMDIEMLSLILDENKTYQDATKEVFLEKLNEAFEKFKKESDTQLKPYPGVCQSTECTNSGCTGYSFVGNNSGAALDLIFDEKNGEVHDIYYCNGMASDSPKLDETKAVRIHIWADEQADYVPTPEYLYQVQLADKASEEILTFSDNCISKETISFIVNKYESLYYSLPDVFSGIVRFDNFTDPFWSMKYLSKYISYEDLIKKALSDFRNKDMGDYYNLLNWLFEYEEIGLEVFNILYFDTLDNNQDGLLIVDERFKFYVSPEEFKIEIEFATLFEQKYWSVINKYEVKDETLVKGVVYHSPSTKRLKDYIKEDNVVIPDRNKLLPDSQICNWVPIRYMAQDSSSPSGKRLSQAHELFHQDEYQNALDLYKELLETRNDFQEAWIGLAVTQYMLGNYDEALTASYRLHEWRYRAFLNIFSKQCELKSKLT
jgi:tetratricopeptide (TPR) repeat protein